MENSELFKRLEDLEGKKKLSLIDGVKILLVVLPLIAGSGLLSGLYTNKHTETVANETVDNNLEDRFKKLEQRIDSSQSVFEKKEMAAIILHNGVAAEKGLSAAEGAVYVMDILNFADDKMKEDSAWQNVEKPMLYKLYEWYLISKFDCDFIRKKEDKWYYVDCDISRTLRPLIFGRGKSNWTKDALYYRNGSDEPIRISEQSEMAFYIN